MGSTPRVRDPRAAAAILIGLLAGGATGCLTRLEGLGVPDPAARSLLAAATITFASDNHLYLARGDGTSARQVIEGGALGSGGAIFMPALTTDGTRLLFLGARDLDVRDSTGRDLSLNIVDLKGTRITQWRRVLLKRLVPPGPGGRQEVSAAAGASWSQDGSRIAVGLNREATAGGDAVAIFDARGTPTNIYLLSGRDLARVGSPSWQADTRSLFLGLSGDEIDGGIIARLDPGGAGTDLALTDLGPGLYPALDPGGRRIAVVDDHQGQWDLVILSLEGAVMDRVTRPGGRGLSRPFWSADGRFLYYYSLASTGPLGLATVTVLRCLDTQTRQVFNLARVK